MRWKDVKIFQEIELRARRGLTQCGLVCQDSDIIFMIEIMYKVCND